MKIAIGSDHGGFELKQQLISAFREKNNEFIDVGCRSSEAVDYPDYAVLVAHEVLAKRVDLGIMIDGAGVGSGMALNKIKGIRAAVCNDIYTARNAREHNDANVLTMGSMVVGRGKAMQIVETFLQTSYQGGRHQKRIEKIMKLEETTQMSADSETGISGNAVMSLVEKIIGTLTTQAPTNTQPSAITMINGGSRLVITEAYLREKSNTGCSTIKIPENAIMTPLALDYARDKKLIIQR